MLEFEKQEPSPNQDLAFTFNKSEAAQLIASDYSADSKINEAAGLLLAKLQPGEILVRLDCNRVTDIPMRIGGIILIAFSLSFAPQFLHAGFGAGSGSIFVLMFFVTATSGGLMLKAGCASTLYLWAITNRNLIRVRRGVATVFPFAWLVLWPSPANAILLKARTGGYEKFSQKFCDFQRPEEMRKLLRQITIAAQLDVKHRRE